MWARIVGMQVVAAGYLLLRLYFQVPFEVMVAGLVAVLFAFVIGWPIGFFVGRYLGRDTDVDTTAFKIVASLNLVAWAVPVAGAALSTMTLQFSKQSDTKRVYYWILSAVGCYGAMATAGITGARSMRMHQVYDSCSAAAPSDWWRDDIDNYCLRGIPRTSLASSTSPQSD